MSTGVMYNAIPSTVADPANGLAAKAFSLQYLKALYAKQGAWKHLRNFDADVAQFGETVTMPSFPRLTAANVTVSTGAFSYDNTSVLAQTVTISKSKAVAYSIPETTLVQSKIDVRSAFAEEAGRAINDAIDADVAGLCASLTTNSAGSANADLTDAYVLAALGKLVENYVDLSNPDDLVWVLPTSQFAATKGLKSYTSYRMYAGATNAEAGNDLRPVMDSIYGIPVHFRGDSALTVSSGKIGGLFFRDSVGVAIQRAPSMRQPIPIPGTINTQLLCYALYGVDLIKQAVACKVLCK